MSFQVPKSDSSYKHHLKGHNLGKRKEQIQPQANTQSSIAIPLITRYAHAMGDRVAASLDRIEGIKNPKNSIISKISYEFDDINVELLNNEINSILKKLSVPHSDLSIPQQIIKTSSENPTEFPELNKIKQYAKTYTDANSGIILPGGYSINPKFYGDTISEEDEKENYNTTNPQREIMEFFLIDQCKLKGIPLLGICRGHQVISTYFKGTLKQTSIGDIQQGRYRAIKQETTAYYDSPSKVYFNHRQIVRTVGNELEKVISINSDMEKENLFNELIEVKNELRKFKIDSIHLIFGDDGLNSKEYKEFSDSYDPKNEDSIKKALIEKRITQLQDNGFDTDTINTMVLPAYIKAIEGICITEDYIFKNYKGKIENFLKMLDENQIILGLQNKHGAPIIGVQFHPEAFSLEDTKIEDKTQIAITKENLKILSEFKKLTTTKENKTKTVKALKTLFNNWSIKDTLNIELKSTRPSSDEDF